MDTYNRRTVLVSPLEWGLGHTVRVIPVIDHLIRSGHRVVIASSGRSLQLLKDRFPNALHEKMSFPEIRYSRRGFSFLKLLLQLPIILRHVRANRKQVRDIIAKHNVTHIISDNRYGISSRGIPSAFITNQLWLKAPKGFGWTEPLFYRYHLFILRNFMEIWLPDYRGMPNISGIQTHPSRLPRKVRYLGPISRFTRLEAVEPPGAMKADVLVLISGPEPQRSILEEMLTEYFRWTARPAVIFRGLPPENQGRNPRERQIGCIRWIDHGSDEHILWYILNTPFIICRPGNLTVTDLLMANRTALLVPTPGHTEQEYVARHLSEQKLFEYCPQRKIIAYLTAKDLDQASMKLRGKRVYNPTR